MIYFISDTHFNHKNIIEYCKRPFKSVEEMNENIIKNWNSIVTSADIIYHLGDLALGRKEQVKNIICKLNGKKYIVRGNHDRLGIRAYQELGIDVLKYPPIRLDEYKIILSHIPLPDTQIPNDFINLHGHIHDKKLYECIEKYDPKLYSIEKHINISCDVTEFKPLSLEEIKLKVRRNL